MAAANRKKLFTTGPSRGGRRRGMLEPQRGLEFSRQSESVQKNGNRFRRFVESDDVNGVDADAVNEGDRRNDEESDGLAEKEYSDIG